MTDRFDPADLADAPKGASARALGDALTELRHDRFGFYGPVLRAQLLGGLSVPISATQYRLLRAVQAASPQGLTAPQLADQLLTDPARTSRVVERLVRLSLATRIADDVDRRQRYIVPTDAGRQLLDEAERTRTAFLDRILGGWTAEEVSALSGLLSRFNDDVRRLPGTGDLAGER